LFGAIFAEDIIHRVPKKVCGIIYIHLYSPIMVAITKKQKILVIAVINENIIR